jgi:hypothetical protein
MADLGGIANQLHRLVKIALDTGEADSLEEAHRIFTGYRVQILLGPDVSISPVLQAALLTAVNCSARSLLGGVSVIGATGPLRVSLPWGKSLEQAVCALGARMATDIDPSTPVIIFGDIDIEESPAIALRVTFDGWAGGVVPARSSTRLAEHGDFTPAGVLAGALAVSEVFQHLRHSHPLAGRRAMGLSLWQPERDWRDKACDAPAVERLPASAWLVGLGNLGQAYLWTLGLLPYGRTASPTLVLQDFDVLAPSNLSTSLLTTETQIGIRKTRAMAHWAEARGFKTMIIERPFAVDFHVAAMEPTVALIGVDNPLARRQVEDVGFERVIEAGLGKGPQDFLGFNIHSFPASRPARECWSDEASVAISLDQPAYRALVEATGDQCGTLQLAGRTIGAPFVGAVVGTLVVSELVRLTLGAHRYEYLSCHLRGLDGRTVISGTPWPISNPGSVLRTDCF